MNASDVAFRVIADARTVYLRKPDGQSALADLDSCEQRLREPLRIALAGTLKAGKSTLLNALIGEELAPMDATECTKIVTWFHHGATPSVRAHHVNGMSAPVPIVRDDGRLSFSLDALDPASISRLTVDWPTSELKRATVIDTPGTASLNADVSARTLDLLAPRDGTSGADAVLYLLRNTTAGDVGTLTEISRQVGGSGAPLGVIGVISRADEIGVGRIDAMLSAKEVAAKAAAELSASGLCQAVVPVAGLVGLTARTLRQREFGSLSELAGLPPEQLQRAMLSADRFCWEDPDLPVPAEDRRRLLERFGMFGIRLSLALLGSGVRDAQSLADELIARSGLGELQSLIEVQFGQRAEQLKAHSACTELRRIFTRYRDPETAALSAAVDRALRDTHGFAEVRLLAALRSRDVGLTAGETNEVTRLLGGYGTSVGDRLSLDPFEAMTTGRTAAHAAAQRWRIRAQHPLNDSFTEQLCRATARSAEGIIAEMDAAAEHADARSRPPRSQDIQQQPTPPQPTPPRSGQPRSGSRAQSGQPPQSGSQAQAAQPPESGPQVPPMHPAQPPYSPQQPRPSQHPRPPQPPRSAQPSPLQQPRPPAPRPHGPRRPGHP